jgi:hypothetical protein
MITFLFLFSIVIRNSLLSFSNLLITLFPTNGILGANTHPITTPTATATSHNKTVLKLVLEDFVSIIIGLFLFSPSAIILLRYLCFYQHFI